MKRARSEIGADIAPLRKGKRPATKTGKNAAYQKFTEFWGRCCIGLEMNETNVCKTDIFGKFANYLTQTKTSSGTDFMVDSAKQYLSGAKETVKNMYPNNPEVTSQMSE